MNGAGSEEIDFSKQVIELSLLTEEEAFLK